MWLVHKKSVSLEILELKTVSDIIIKFGEKKSKNNKVQKFLIKLKIVLDFLKHDFDTTDYLTFRPL